MRAFASLIVLFSTAIFLSAQTTKWTPDRTQVALLAGFTKTGDYSIQPPKGYKLIIQHGQQGETAYAFAGVTREDGTRAMLMVATAPIKKGDTTTVDQMAAKAVGAVGKNRTGFKQDKPEHGTVGGLKFVRIGWQGKLGTFPTKGFHYVTKDGNQFVMLWSQDVMPRGEPALKLAEASIRTFKKG